MILLERVGVSKNEAIAVLSRVMQAVAWFLCARLLLDARGGEEYGAFSLILSIAFWLQMCDLGITSFLRTEFPRMKVDGRAHHIPRMLVRGIFAVAAICLFGGALLLVLGYLLPGGVRALLRLVNLDQVLALAQSGWLLLVLCVYSSLVVSGNLMQAYLSVDGRQYKYYIVSMVGFALQPLALWWALQAGLSLVLVVAVFCLVGVGPVAVQVFIGAILSFRQSIIAGGSADETAIKLLNRTSFSYLFIQLVGALASNLDLLLVSYLFGLKEVAVYSMFKLMIQLPISMHAQFNLQSWPRYTEQINAGAIDRVRKAFSRNITIVLLASLGLMLVLGLFGPAFVRFWSAGSISASLGMSLLFALFGTCYMLLNAINVLMYAFGHTRTAFHLAWSTPPVMIALSILFRDFGPESVIASNIVVYVIGLFAGAAFYMAAVGSGRTVQNSMDGK